MSAPLSVLSFESYICICVDVLIMQHVYSDAEFLVSLSVTVNSGAGLSGFAAL